MRSPGYIQVRKEERRVVVLMKRPGSAWGRSLANHDHILAAMQGLAKLQLRTLSLRALSPSFSSEL
jgi:ribulose-5-phosphate 4-epimerase/fuculose-1-phosphate aldolase